MPSNSPFVDSIKSEAVKWLFIAVIAFISAGGFAIAKDKFYTKSEVDLKDYVLDKKIDRVADTLESEGFIQRSHIIELNKIQNENIVDKLEEIGADVKELGADVKDLQQKVR